MHSGLTFMLSSVKSLSVHVILAGNLLEDAVSPGPLEFWRIERIHSQDVGTFVPEVVVVAV